MPPENNTPTSTSGNPPSNPESSLKQIRTFQGDVAEALTHQNESLVSIQQTEAARRRATGAPNPSDENENKRRDFVFLLVGSIFFIVVGVAGAWYGYREYLSRTAPPVLVIPENRFISPTGEVTLPISSLNREGFAVSFNELVSKTKPEELTHVVLKKDALEISPSISTAEFFSLLESQAPGSLVRSFGPLFMVGSVGESPFLIIKLASFENAFAGMLLWETTMAEDLTPIFGNANVVKAIAPTSVFRDVIVRNKDVRVLETVVESTVVTGTGTSTATTTGTSTVPVLLYSFFDNSMLIITDRIEALQTLIDRLTRERLSR